MSRRAGRQLGPGVHGDHGPINSHLAPVITRAERLSASIRPGENCFEDYTTRIALAGSPARDEVAAWKIEVTDLIAPSRLVIHPEELLDGQDLPTG